jgi:hypothetical protein
MSSMLCSAFDFLIAGFITFLKILFASVCHFTAIHFSVPVIPYSSAVSARVTGIFIFFAHASVAHAIFASVDIICRASCAVGFMAVL